MKYQFKFGILLFALIALSCLFACTQDEEDDAEDVIEDALGFEVEFDEDDLDVATPHGWNFLFAAKLKGDNVDLVESGFKVDLTLLDDIKGIDLSEIDQMIAIVRVDDMPGFGNRLRYGNKLIIKDNILRLDTEAIEKLGDSIGQSGEGWYAIYYADVQNGYIRGMVECEGQPIGDALAVITSGGFFTYSADDGSVALPTVDGIPGVITVSSDDCACAVGAPVTDTGQNKNPKSNDPGDTPDSFQFADGTSAVYAGVCECCPPIPADDDDDDDAVDDDDDAVDDDDDAVDDDDDAVDDDDDDDDDISDIDFENGSLDGWQVTSDCEIYGVSNEAYGDLFPDGNEAYYLYVSSGGNLVPSCTMTLTTTVPSGASELEISYDFVSQEYEEWIGSMYNDIFTTIIQGSTEYLVNRTVNNVALDNDWLAIDEAAALATFSQIASSSDAQYNPTNSGYHSNGPYKFDGHLIWGGTDDGTPRGCPEDMNLGRTATVSLPMDMSTITIIVTISDVGDRIYDSVGVIDYLKFK